MKNETEKRRHRRKQAVMQRTEHERRHEAVRRAARRIGNETGEHPKKQLILFTLCKWTTLHSIKQMATNISWEEMKIECQFYGTKYIKKKYLMASSTTVATKWKWRLLLEEIFTIFRRHLEKTDQPHFTNFKNIIRSYNPALSFALMDAAMADPSDRGQYCFRVNVQIYSSIRRTAQTLCAVLYRWLCNR